MTLRERAQIKICVTMSPCVFFKHAFSFSASRSIYPYCKPQFRRHFLAKSNGRELKGRDGDGKEARRAGKEVKQIDRTEFCGTTWVVKVKPSCFKRWETTMTQHAFSRLKRSYFHWWNHPVCCLHIFPPETTYDLLSHVAPTAPNIFLDCIWVLCFFGPKHLLNRSLEH